MTEAVSKYAAPSEIDAEFVKLATERDRLLRALEINKLKTQQLEGIYEERGGWNRAFLVNNTNGHVHRSMQCGTCFIDTEFKWLTDLSGMTEEQIVELAGERACTVCYPTAPAEVRERPSQIRSDEDDARDQRAAERQQKQAEKAAKGITRPDGSALKVGPNGDKPSTERAARILVGQFMADILFYRHNGEGHPYEPQWLQGISELIEAISHKTGENPAEIHAEALKKAQAKVRKQYKDAGLNPALVAKISDQINW